VDWWGIRAVGFVDVSLDMEAGLDVGVIADRTGPQIETQQATPPGARLLGALDLHRGFDRKRGVADPAAARHECHDRRSDIRPAAARNDVQNFLRSALDRYPVRAAAAD